MHLDNGVRSKDDTEIISSDESRSMRGKAFKYRMCCRMHLVRVPLSDSRDSSRRAENAKQGQVLGTKSVNPAGVERESREWRGMVMQGL